MSWGKTLSKTPLVDGYTCYHSNKSPQGYQDHRQVTVSHHSPELCPLFREGTLVCLTRVLTMTATFSSQHHKLKENVPNSKNHVKPRYGAEVIRQLGKDCSNTCWNGENIICSVHGFYHKALIAVFIDFCKLRKFIFLNLFAVSLSHNYIYRSLLRHWKSYRTVVQNEVFQK